MSEESAKNLDRIRSAALAKADHLEKAFSRTLLAAGLFEGTLLIAILVVIDFSDKLHLLVLFSAVLVYGTLAIGLIALGVRINLYTHRILKALEVAVSNESPS